MATGNRLATMSAAEIEAEVEALAHMIVARTHGRSPSPREWFVIRQSADRISRLAREIDRREEARLFA
jgi:hypothetical protein